MELRTAIKHFYFYMKNNGHSTNTAVCYRSILEDFETQYPVSIEDVTLENIQAYLSKFAHLAASSRNLKRACLRSFFNWLCDAGYLEKNPSRLIRMEAEAMKEAKYLSLAEIQKFREAIKVNPRDQVRFEILLSSGMRVGEIVQLDVGTVKNRQSFLITGKGKRSRRVYLTKPLMPMIATFVDGRPDNDPLFCSCRGTRLSVGGVQTLFQTYLSRAGIKNHYSIHCTRHTFGTFVYKRARDLRLTPELLGHSSPSTTAPYAHVFESDKRKAVNHLY